MPPILYEVGSGKPYSTHQAAVDAIIADYAALLTADVEVRVNSGETFSDNTVTDLIVTSALGHGGFRLSFTSSIPYSPFIVDMADNSSTRFFFNDGQSGNAKKFTFRDIKVINNANNAHTIIGSGDQKNGSSIVERCDFEVYGRACFKFNGSGPGAARVIWRNNYLHGRNGSFASIFTLDSPYYTLAVGNTFRHMERAYELDIPNGTLESYDNIFQDVTVNLIESNGSEAQFNANYSANGNLYFSVPADFLSLYSVPNTYTLAAYKTLTGDDAVYVNADPMLTSFADPHLLDGSPAKWAGVDSAYLTEDIDGDPRHSPPSIGADEFVNSLVLPEPTPLPGVSSSVPSDSIKHVLSATRFQGSTVLDTTNEVGKIRLQNVATLRDTFLSVFEATSKADVHLNTSAGNKLKAIAVLNPSTATVADIVNAVKNS